MIDVFDNHDAMSHAAAALFAQSAHQAVHARGRFTVALAGGNTPACTYELLSQPPYRDQIPWQNVHIFWGDERCVPPDDPRSNQHMARHTLLNQVPIPPENIHPIDGTLPPDAAAQAYESELREFAQHNITFLDLALLGIGTDGHTASLFPDDTSDTPNTSQRWALPVAPTENRLARITLTPHVLNHARQIAFLVSGSTKADILHRIIEDPANNKRLPALQIKPSHQEPHWLLDRAAAAKLRFN